MKTRTFRTLVFAAVLMLATAAQGVGPKGEVKDEPWMKPDPAAMKRWQDMRFGMFIHWGTG